MQKIREATNNTSMKNVKGLEDRLSGLEVLLCTSRRYVEEQKTQAKVRACVRACVCHWAEGKQI